MKTIHKIAWLHIKDRRVLMLRSFGKDAFYFPGGKPELGESDAQTLGRELREEIGLRLQQRTLRLHGNFATPAHGQKEATELRCTTYFGDCVGEPVPRSEIVEMRYFSHDERHELTPMGVKVFDRLRLEGLI